MWRSAWVLLAVLSVALPSAAAPDDDLLAPLTPPTKSAPKRRPPPATTAKRPKKPAKTPAVPSDRPTVEKSELLVTLRAPLEGAHLFVDDRDQGRLPLAAREVTPGFHTITVRKSGFSEYVQQVDLKSGQRIELSVQLQQLTAALKVHGTPPGALVSVDGGSAGTLPLNGFQLTPGSHQLLVQAPGFAPWTQSFSVRAGQDELLQVDLTRVEQQLPLEAAPLAATAFPPPQVARNDDGGGFFTKWYTWVGIGVVAGGLAAGGWAIGAHAHPTPASSTVCSGPCDAVLKPHAPGF